MYIPQAVQPAATANAIVTRSEWAYSAKNAATNVAPANCPTSGPWLAGCAETGSGRPATAASRIAATMPRTIPVVRMTTSNTRADAVTYNWSLAQQPGQHPVDEASHHERDDDDLPREREDQHDGGRDAGVRNCRYPRRVPVTGEPDQLERGLRLAERQAMVDVIAQRHQAAHPAIVHITRPPQAISRRLKASDVMSMWNSMPSLFARRDNMASVCDRAS